MALTEDGRILDFTKSCQDSPYFESQERGVNVSPINFMMVYTTDIHVYSGYIIQSDLYIMVYILKSKEPKRPHLETVVRTSEKYFLTWNL